MKYFYREAHRLIFEIPSCKCPIEIGQEDGMRLHGDFWHNISYGSPPYSICVALTESNLTNDSTGDKMWS